MLQRPPGLAERSRSAETRVLGNPHWGLRCGRLATGSSPTMALVLRLEQDRVCVCPLPFAPRLRRPLGCISATPTKTPRLALMSGLPTSCFRQFFCCDRMSKPNSAAALLPQAQAFPALLTHAYCYDAQDRSHTRRLVDSYLAIVSLVPVFALQYRPDLQQLPQLIEIIQNAAGSSSAKSSTFRLPGVVP